MKFLNNIEVGSSPNFTFPLTDGSSNQILQTNGSGTVSWVDLPAGTTDTNDFVTAAAFNTSTGVVSLTIQNQTAVTVDLDGRYLTSETHSSQGYLTDTGSGITNVLANYNAADTIGWANESNTLNSTNFRLMSDGSQLSLANDDWANRNTGGVSPKYFVHIAPDGAGSPRSSVLNDADEFFSAKVAQANTYMSIRNANNLAGDEVGLMFRSDNDDSTIRIKGIAGSNSTIDETFRIESVNSSSNRHRLHIVNYGDQHFRLAQASGDQPFMFYFGDGTAMGNSTNPFATLGVRIDANAIAVDGTNNPSTPNYRFLDDGDTGMFLASTGVTAFSSGGTQVLSIPTSAGTNGQVLTTDGSGTSSWTTVASGGGGLVTSLTTTGTSGAATLSGGGVLNIPQYANTTYSNGQGLDITGTVFSVSTDLRTDVDYIGFNSDNYIDMSAANVLKFVVSGSEAFRIDTSGNIHAAADVVAFSTTISDARLKEDVETIESALEKVSQLRGVEYTWKKGGRKGQREIGLIAQEVEEVVPSIVREHQLPLVEGLDDASASYKTVDYEKLVALLIEANKEQQDIISQLEERIIDIENRL